MLPPTRQSFSSLNDSPSKKALLSMRVIWTALLVGQATFLVVVAMVILPNKPPPDHPQPLLNWISVIFLLTIVPVMFAIRGMIFRRSRAEDGVLPAAYASGNILFWSACEGASFFGLVVAILNASLWPTILSVAVAMALQVVTFPVASKMHASPYLPVS